MILFAMDWTSSWRCSMNIIYRHEKMLLDFLLRILHTMNGFLIVRSWLWHMSEAVLELQFNREWTEIIFNTKLLYGGHVVLIDRQFFPGFLFHTPLDHWSYHWDIEISKSAQRGSTRRRATMLYTDQTYKECVGNPNAPPHSSAEERKSDMKKKGSRKSEMNEPISSVIITKGSDNSYQTRFLPSFESPQSRINSQKRKKRK